MTMIWFLTVLVQNGNTNFKFGFMVLNSTFSNISVILWWSVLLVKETRVPRKNH